MTAILTAGDALLQDIIANPGADGLRLIYADWLEEFGGDAEQARAEFIRLQVALAAHERERNQSSPAYIPFSRRVAMRSREDELWNARTPNTAGQAEFLIPPAVFLPSYGPTEAIDQEDMTKKATFEGVIWRRGFPDLVRLPLAAWQRHGPMLVASHPITRVECPGIVRSGIVFRGSGDGDVPRDFWFKLHLGEWMCIHGACVGSTNPQGPQPPGCRGRGTHAYFGSQQEGERQFSELLIGWAKPPAIR